MAYTITALEILRKAEIALRDVVGKAAAAGDYDAIVGIVKIAKSIDDMSLQLSGGATPNLGVTNSPSAGERSVSEVPERKTHQNSRVSRPGSHKGYPAFFRSNDVLIKVGWSKKHRAEYEHRAPKQVLHAWVQALRSSLNRNGRFRTEDLLPLHHPDGSQIPDYQSYLFLAWFCLVGAVDREARQGYKVKSSDRFAELIEQLWTDVPEKE